MHLKPRVATAPALALALMASLAAAEPNTALAQLAPERTGGVGNGSGGATPPARSGAEDQTALPGTNSTGSQTLITQSLPISPPPRVGLFTGFGKTLLDDGIDIHGVTFDTMIGNPTAGVDRGHTSNLGVLRPAVDLDLSRLAGIPGGNVHLALTFFGLRSDKPQIASQFGGALNGFQSTPVIETNIVSVATYEQRFMDGRFSVEVGRTDLFNYFLLPNSLDTFTNYSTTFEVDGDFTSLPYPTWGGRATYKLSPQWYLQGGAFADNFHQATAYGDRLGVGASPGAQVIAEVGQRSEFRNAAYPSNMEAGYMQNTRDGRSNLKGTGAPANTLLQPVNYPGGGVFFLQGEQTLWRGAARPGTAPLAPPANIALYGSADASVEKPQPIDMDAMVGVNFTGLIPTRELDSIGLQAKYSRLSQAEANAETRRQSITAGRGPSQNRDGFSFEAIANIQVTPAFALRPFIQYYVNPDNYYPPATVPGRQHDGVQAGFFAIVSIGRLLGTSEKSF